MSKSRRIERVYADNAATTRLSEAALEAMKPYLLDVFGNPSQPYSFSRPAKRAMRKARELIADCINASPDEVVFTSGGTESDNYAIKGFALQDANKRAIVTTPIEHHAILNSCEAMRSIGHAIRYLSVNNDGIVDIDSMCHEDLGSGTLVSCMSANNEIGSIQPITSLCELAHEGGSLFHTDAVQAIGHVPIDVKAMGVDLLSASAHKFNGPRGIGFLYIKKGTRIAPYATGGNQEGGRRAGTENVAAIVGMAVALRENCDEIAANQGYLRVLEQLLEAELTEYGINYRRNGINQLPGLLSLSFPGKSGETLLHRLDLMGIAVSTGSACNGASDVTSHVLEAIGLEENLARGTIRVSLGKGNTKEDVLRIASALNTILNSRRG